MSREWRLSSSVDRGTRQFPCARVMRQGQVFTFDIDIFQELLASDITPGADFYDWTFLAGDIFPVYSCFEAW